MLHVVSYTLYVIFLGRTMLHVVSYTLYVSFLGRTMLHVVSYTLYVILSVLLISQAVGFWTQNQIYMRF
jgi:hypothetical protein